MSDDNNKDRKVLLIGWDGADWEHITPLLDDGQLPTLEALINDGVMGNLATLEPVLSPMLWNSVATGKYAFKHGVHGFIEPDPINGGVRPFSSYSRKCKALWNIFTQEGMRSNVVGWWASHPAERINGTIVTNAFNGVTFEPEKGWIYPQGTIHPPDKAQFLAQFKVFPKELTQEHILPFIPHADRIDQQRDPRLISFAKVLAEAATVQAVATTIMETEPWDFTAIYFTAIDHFSHGFMRYRAPRMPNVSEEDFEIYKDVVEGAYRFHDMMLERQLQLAGPDTTVILCSDHGFQSRHLRPLGTPREPAGPANWHRQFGIIVMKGPGIKRDERIYGASLIDIAPTILTLFGLPTGEDMDGRTLVEAFEQPPDLKTIPSWDDVSGDSGWPPVEPAMDKEAADQLLEQFAALGYINDPGKDKEKAAREAAVEKNYNLARNYLWAGDNDNALRLYEEIVRQQPWETRFINQLAEVYRRCGYLRQAERLIKQAIDNIEESGNPSVLITWAATQHELGQEDRGLAAMRRAEALRSIEPAVYIQLGDVYRRVKKWDDAERVYRKGLTLHRESALAHQGLSHVYLRKRMNQEAADAALNAVSLVHRLPQSHFNLGVALARSRQPERAALAFETTLQFAPDNLRAHRWLSRLYQTQLDDPQRASMHQLEVQRIRGQQPVRKTDRSQRREQLFDLPEFPSEEERREILLRERPDPKSPLDRSGKTFVVVSGLPRSGTSLMMQMLAAGGMEVQTDSERQADPDNPRGYFEWEELKQIGRQPELLDADGLDKKAIKAVSALIRQMPPQHDYKVVFMNRPIEEVVKSQEIMVERRGTTGANLESEELERGLESHRNEILNWMAKAPHMQALVIDYPALVKSPDKVLPEIIEFLGEDRLPNAAAMIGVVDQSLYRQRKNA